jgi:polar amino acid transport system ATP-binding protein
VSPAGPGGGYGPAAASPAADAVRVEGVFKSFGASPVLRDVSLSVPAHQVICLIGASGSGKSTLLRCINLLEPIDRGSISVLGHQITGTRVDENLVRRAVGIVFQSYNLFPHMNVLQNVTLAPVKALGTPKGAAVAEARELLGRFGLADKETEYPDRLSGGQQQRVAIVRALAVRPQILLLDEVTSALDPELVAEVLEVIRELAADGMTMLIATHEMGFARDIASRVCFLADGAIVEDAPPGELFTSPRDERTQRFLRSIIAAGRLSPGRDRYRRRPGLILTSRHQDSTLKARPRTMSRPMSFSQADEV